MRCLTAWKSWHPTQMYTMDKQEYFPPVWRLKIKVFDKQKSEEGRDKRYKTWKEKIKNSD